MEVGWRWDGGGGEGWDGRWDGGWGEGWGCRCDLNPEHVHLYQIRIELIQLRSLHAQLREKLRVRIENGATYALQTEHQISHHLDAHPSQNPRVGR